MISNPEHGGKTGDLLDLVGPEVREAWERSRKSLDEAAWLRASSGKRDEPLKDCEESIREKPPRGRRWKTVMANCTQAVTAANEVHLKVLRHESEALPHFRAAVTGIKVLAETRMELIPEGTMELLDECALLRSEAVDWRERALKYPTGLFNLGAKATSEQLLSLLEERRRLLGEARTREQRAERLERRALHLSGGDDGHEDLVVETSSEAPEIRKTSSAPETDQKCASQVVPGQGLLLRIAELERELADALHGAESERGEEVRRSEARIRRIEELHASSLSREREVREAAEARIVEVQALLDDATARLEKSMSEGGALGIRLSEVEHELESRRADFAAERDGIVRSAETQIELLIKRRNFLKERVLAIKRREVESKARLTALESESTEAAQAAASWIAELDATRAAAEGKVVEVTACLSDLEGRVEELKRSESGLKSRVEEMEPRVKAAETSRAEAEELLNKSFEELEAAHQERDEALVLASSLIRRLEAGGGSMNDESLSDSLATELASVRATIGAQESELKRMREQFLAYKEDLAAQIEELKRATAGV